MATSNRDRVGRALDLLSEGLKPYVERELTAAYGRYWITRVTENWQHELRWLNDDEPHLDITALLRIMWEQWNDVFRKTLGHAERSLVSELRETRNRWAHQHSFTLDDTYRALDSVHRLLTAVSAAEQAREIERQKQEVLRLRFEEEARRETRKAATTPIEGQPAGGLKPWREIVTPHPDVASGRYQQAEFAADLNQVYRGEGSDEYRDPQAFFQRTYLTEGLRYLLTTALRRLSGSGGDPVIELQTNFGGGKTHSMLALYHLFSGITPADLPGIDPVLHEAGVTTLPQVQRVVLVGTALSPAQAQRKPDGTIVNTLWGELAWQLLGREGYALVAEADRQGVSPGSNVLVELFQTAAPCLILIDEWVAYVRQLYIHPDDADKGIKRSYPGGSFEANMTFAQALTEAAKAVPRVLVVASLPASDIEIGGEGGREALSRLRNVFGRLESIWKPATAEEGFEIVRRRLFQDIPGQNYAARDAVIKAFMEMYRTQPGEFPAEVREAEYERRLKAAYPIHPELFDRLYNDWCTLERFQRTRGVLRLMSAVIHALWVRDDRSLLIMPASVPIDDPATQHELTRYFEEAWAPVISRDVDGPNSLPLRIDRENPNLGRYSAARRVARTLYLGSAPTLHSATKGLDDRHIKLGCAQPGESVATFGDALRRLTDQATHLYVDGQRYWFSTQPTVNRLAQDRAAQQSLDDVHTEIIERLRRHARDRSDFSAVHVAPNSATDVPDERDARLVILPPSATHSRHAEGSPARLLAAQIAEHRSTGPRRYRNTLAFLAADATRLNDLEQAVRQWLAWRSIEKDRETLNLDAFQSRQAAIKRTDADKAIEQRIPETYVWLLVPTQPEPTGPIEWSDLRLQGQDGLVARASKKMRGDELLITVLDPTVLRIHLDSIPLWRGAHVELRQLADDFAQYLYLPRLRNTDVLLKAIQDGIARPNWEQETFAYAESYDEERKRYRGLHAGEQVTITLDAGGLVVKPEVARGQFDSETPTPLPTPVVERENRRGAEGTEESQSSSRLSGSAPERVLRRFHGSKQLNPRDLARDAGTIGTEIVQHLVSRMGARVTVRLEIDAELPEGAPEDLVRTVTENCRTLRFESAGFEES
jgi:predicted AAA+ superfamily ATPase